LVLETPPNIRIESRISRDKFYRFLEQTWMAQQLPWAVLFYAWGGWGFVFWTKANSKNTVTPLVTPPILPVGFQ